MRSGEAVNKKRTTVTPQTLLAVLQPTMDQKIETSIADLGRSGK